MFLKFSKDREPEELRYCWGKLYCCFLYFFTSFLCLNSLNLGKINLQKSILLSSDEVQVHTSANQLTSYSKLEYIIVYCGEFFIIMWLTQTWPVIILPSSVSLFSRYMYTDDVDLKSFDHACEVCYAAKKYMLPALVKKCTTYIWSDIDPANTCRAYEFARLFDEPDLLNRCMKVKE